MRGKQKFPKMWIKIGKFAVITNWPDRLPIIYVKFPTLSTRETYFYSRWLARKKFGIFYWINEYQAEVIKDTSDVTHPNNRIRL